jgi:TDG/mug DNA glycosylase family protein
LASSLERYPFLTLPDLLAPGLRLVFVGINPSSYSVEQGHYFARPTNRFWPAFSRSTLSAAARAGLGLERLGPAQDVALLAYGIGFTDVVKLPSSNAAALKPADYQRWAPRLLERLARWPPLVACFHGVTGYRAFLRFGLGRPEPNAQPGPQAGRLGSTHLYVVPNPSPANAHVRLEDQVAWYDRLASFLQVASGARSAARGSWPGS